MPHPARLKSHLQQRADSKSGCLQLAFETIELGGSGSGFCAGDAQFLDAYAEVRNMCAPTVPGPVQVASAAAGAWPAGSAFGSI